MIKGVCKREEERGKEECAKGRASGSGGGGSEIRYLRGKKGAVDGRW